MEKFQNPSYLKQICSSKENPYDMFDIIDTYESKCREKHLLERCPYEFKMLSKNDQWFFRRNYHLKPSQVLNNQFYDLCAICYEAYPESSVGQKKHVTKLYCDHHFHTECIEKWFGRSSKCPMCKKDFRDHPVYQQWDEDYYQKIKTSKNTYLRSRLYDLVLAHCNHNTAMADIIYQNLIARRRVLGIEI